MKGSASAFRDWAQLPPLVLHLISEKVKSITDYVLFRAVCAPWRSASLAKPGHLPHQLPWLMMPHHLDPTADDGIRLFDDLWQEKMHKIHLPEAIGKMCCASYRGWLLLVAPGGTELFLLNPLTRARVELPPFANAIKILGAHQNFYQPGCSYLGDFAITKINFTADLTDPNCLIMVVLPFFQWIYFCKVGDRCWTDAVPHPVRSEAMLSNLWVKDIAYNNGKFFLLYQEALFIHDLNQQRVQDQLFFKPELQRVPKFFLKGKSGLYIVAVYHTEVIKEALGQKIDLYEVQEQPLEVKRIADASDTSIFHGDNYNYLAVHADEWDSLPGGCMYMQYDCVQYGGGSCYKILFSKLDGGKPKVVVPVGEMPIRPPGPAMWFQPSFV